MMRYQNYSQQPHLNREPMVCRTLSPVQLTSLQLQSAKNNPQAKIILPQPCFTQQPEFPIKKLLTIEQNSSRNFKSGTLKNEKMFQSKILIFDYQWRHSVLIEYQKKNLRKDSNLNGFILIEQTFNESQIKLINLLKQSYQDSFDNQRAIIRKISTKSQNNTESPFRVKQKGNDKLLVNKFAEKIPIDWNNLKNYGQGWKCYKGDIKEGKMNGEGQLEFGIGDIYEGSFKQGTICGKGIYKTKDGIQIEGIWEEGILVQLLQ